MKIFKSIAFSFIAGVVTIGLSLASASATVIDANWWSNQTSVSNIIDPPGPLGPERLRLAQGFNTGFIEGTVLLPGVDDWTIEALISTDGNVAHPTEFVKVFIDNVELATFFNTPVLTSILFSHSFNGSSFSYRFEFSSPSTTQGEHMIVQRGTVTTPMPEPGAMAILGIGLVGLSIARRRKAASSTLAPDNY